MHRIQKSQASMDANQARLLARLKRSCAGVLLLGYIVLSVYLLAIKPSATEAQKLYASTVLTAIASGSAGYVFGKKEGKAEKE